MKKIPYVAISCLIFGFVSGGILVENRWNKEKIKYEKSINIATAKIRSLELSHMEKEKELTIELNKAKEQYEEDISIINSEHSIRLFEQANRANHYKRQYENKHCNNGELLNKTIQLDKALGEGVGLVKELRSVIILREAEINTLLEVIKNDRKTVNGR